MLEGALNARLGSLGFCLWLCFLELGYFCSLPSSLLELGFRVEKAFGVVSLVSGQLPAPLSTEAGADMKPKLQLESWEHMGLGNHKRKPYSSLID